MVKAQSAMEYLMTYGWAILIIAVVLAVLVQLGIFSTNLFGPRQVAGACRVVALGASGPTTKALVGSCQGGLPQYVSSEAAVDNGFVIVTPPPTLNTFAAGISICIWFDMLTPYPGYSNYIYEQKSGIPDIELTMSPTNVEWITNTGSSLLSANTITQNKWYATCETYNTTTGLSTIYINGNMDNQAAKVFSSTNTGEIYIIDDVSGANDFVGYVSNMQMYNTSLSPAEAKQYYLNGIGGPAIKPSNLVAWWQLNGNINDYSGSNNNGAFPPGQTMGFTAQWTGTYSGPV